MAEVCDRAEIREKSESDLELGKGFMRASESASDSGRNRRVGYKLAESRGGLMTQLKLSISLSLSPSSVQSNLHVTTLVPAHSPIA